MLVCLQGGTMKRMVVAALVALSSNHAHALICKDVFKPALHTLPSAEVERLASQVELLTDRLNFAATSQQSAGQSFHLDVRELDGLLRASARLLESQGAHVRAMRLGGYPALEIIPNASAAPGWNKMAASVKEKLGAKLVYAPASLAKFGADALMAESTSGGRTILISRQSVSVGRGEYRIGEELGHAASNERAATDPNSFMGAIDSIDPRLRPFLAEGTHSHRDQMSNDEIVRSSKNFVRVARALEQGSGNARRELRAIADNAVDVVKVSRVTIESLQKISRSIIESADETGVSMGYDGTPKERSAFVDSERGQILLEPIGPNSVRLDFEGLNVNIEIVVRDRDHSLQRLIPGLQAADPATLRRLQSLLPAIVGQWTSDQTVAIGGIEKSVEAVRRMDSLDDATLAREVRAASQAIAPLIARQRP